MVLVADGLESCLETLCHLRAQTAADRIELVLAGPEESFDNQLAEVVGGLHSVRLLDFDPTVGTPAGRALCILEARAPVVALAETHCFPEPGWAEALIAAHQGPWAGVGPEIGNDNPEATASWANLLVDYSPWVAPATEGPAADLPGHNSSYKRALLLSYADDLPRLFESESILHRRLRDAGHQLYMEPRARVNHRNITRPIPGIVEHFHNGRTFGGLRSRTWHPARRAFYAAASPLIPFLRLSRILRELRRRGRRDLLPGVLPMMLASLIAHALGELTGYVAGGGNAVQGMAKYEIHRDIYVASSATPT